MKWLLWICGVLVGIVVIWIVYNTVRFRMDVKNLLASSHDLSNQTYSEEQIMNLPAPVQRYFKHVLKEGQPYISQIKVKHDGLFKTDLDKDWVDIKGIQYFTASEPGFIWRGKIGIASAVDRFVAGKGRLTVKLLSLVTVADGKGAAYDQGELARWLMESALFPTSLLPNEHLKWSGINDVSASLTYRYKGIDLDFTVFFNEAGEITRVETKRIMNDAGLEKWIGTYSDYREIAGVIVPTTGEAGWNLDSKEVSYARFHYYDIEFD